MKKTGIKKTFVLKDILLDAENRTEPRDRARLELGSYWVKKDNIRNVFEGRATELLFKENTKDKGNIFKTDLKDIVLDQFYNDIVFDIVLPYKKSFANRINTLTNISTLETEIYKEKNTQYDKFSSDDRYDELDLLNFYIFSSRDIKKSEPVQAIITNGFQIDPRLLDSQNAYGEYFSQYALTFPKWAEKFAATYKDKTKTIILDKKDVDLLASDNLNKKLFTKYFKIDLLKDTPDLISKSLLDTRMNLRFLSFLVKSDPANMINLEFASEMIYTSFVNSEDVAAAGINWQSTDKQSGITTILATKVMDETLRNLNYLAWVQESVSDRSTDAINYFDFSDNTNALLIGSSQNFDVPSTNDNIFLTNLYTRVLAGKTKFIIDKNLRTFQDIINGKKCHSEIIGFKIIKTKPDVEPNAPVQTYYFENNDSELLEFVDTQIKEQQVYNYDIYYYVAVLGNRYKYIEYDPSIEETPVAVVQTSGVPTSVITSQVALQSAVQPYQAGIPQTADTQFGAGDKTTNVNSETLTTDSFRKIQRQLQPSRAETYKNFKEDERLEKGIRSLEQVDLLSSRQEMQAPTQDSGAPARTGLAIQAPTSPPPQQGSSPIDSEINSNEFIRVINEPLLHIFEVKANNLIDDFPSLEPTKIELVSAKKPPLAPTVVPIPFKDDRKRIRFNFMRNFGKYKEKFIEILETDAALKKLYEPTQDPVDVRAGITEFEADFMPKDGRPEDSYEVKEDYEIFRTDITPLEYKDFKNKLIKTINNIGFDSTPLSTFDDILEPNKKYYYLFRTIDSDGFKSNPSEIYEIELVINSGDQDFESSGAYYPIIRVFEFPKESGVVKNKSFKQFFRLKAAFQQKLLKDISTSLPTSNLKLGDGIVDPLVWGKNFKIRLTSKQTSRKVDINFKLRYEAKKKS
jgi:hypothetical protein